ncbi:MAG: ATP-dependent DNA helicase RecG [Candidatus Omnitrophica bacterium CG1_02_49_16]|nr:MAG: ATP-dependent DNA helicase RecG [Candidatus Omnitrophica bacterium CG1_02_49_16]
MNQFISLETPLRFIKGVGPERSKTLERLGLVTLTDAFYFFPRRYENRWPIKKISEISFEEKECVSGAVQSRGLIRTKYGKTIFKVALEDPPEVPHEPAEGSLHRTDRLFGVWFNQPYLGKIFLPKSRVIFYGQVERNGRQLQMTHPEYEIIHEDTARGTIHSGRLVPIYALTQDLSQKGIRQLIFRVISEHVRLIQDPLTVSLRKTLGLEDLAFALREIHFPSTPPARQSAYERLVFDEFFFQQIVIQMKKAKFQKENRLMAHPNGEEQVRSLIRSLGFELTGGQKSAIREITNDMKKGRPMNRLVQGDVGSGKTAVAAAGLAFTVANGFQGALMAPTEVLAQQHYFNLTEVLEPLGITCGYLAGELSPQDRQKVLDGLADGSIHVVIGTHALIQSNVRFKNLGLAVVDEQHKFGVFQRAALKEKRPGAHFLLMTATPIPRTLALTLYGDLDISVIAELPKGRQAIKTLWVGENKREEIYKFLDTRIEKGAQAYVICPLIDEPQEPSPKSLPVRQAGALAIHEALSRVFSHRKVGLLHGRMKSAEKKKAMQDFKDRKIEILVSTVVIEVGVDVPNANVMIIENADKFGLAQLHQLRGRVGRGGAESVCVLFSDTANSESVERLGAFESMPSGFDIAEKDLKLRGAGDIIGEKQHGLPSLRIGDLSKDLALLIKARNEAARILEKDPCLASLENRPLKHAIRSRFGFVAAKQGSLTG